MTVALYILAGFAAMQLAALVMLILLEITGLRLQRTGRALLVVAFLVGIIALRAGVNAWRYIYPVPPGA